MQSVKQWIHPVDKKQKSALLAHLIEEHQWTQVLVFSRTKHGADRLCRQLSNKGIPAIAIHGNKSQNQRTRALQDFKNGKAQVMVATDIAARGIDIDQLPQVVNFDLPNVPEDYVHRIGRTGRAGSTGQAISLVSADEFVQLSDIERLTKKILDRKLVDGFEPDHDVPASDLSKRPKKAKKPQQGNNAGRPNNQRSKRNNQNQKNRSKNNNSKKNSRNRPQSKGNMGGNQAPRKK